ncbi:methionyl-tRNA formyltransferase [Ruminococcus sp. YE71]|uniref:methionyl-tRNA formyltransferase n=1 Tax=unclassified Ruminococcus TaxID=2608920 RepID=UPI00089245BB|nr:MULTISPECIES: methionyl-tRNA formyltransferase [unclassified Ruminococcus]SDA21018.1 methionyl-tRNA formyltransferase [Ruminococcus sp. YE78]SFW33151.1 methionyl-tRNA formyltransferase [Ruminococcus sp. YE71]
MKVVFMGTPDFAVAALRNLYYPEPYGIDIEVQAVFTQPDKPKGRGYKLIPPPVKVLAEQHGTPVYQPQSLKKEAEEYVNALRELAPDVIVVAAYGKILPKEVLELPKYGCINIHASLLPEYRGAAPIQRAIYDGKTETGVTVMQMGEGLDTGDMLLKESVQIGENETSSELFEQLAALGADMIMEVLKKAEKGELTPEKQDDSLSTYAAMITKDMCPIDFTKTVFEVHKQICALSESPAAFCFLDGKRLKVYHSEIVSTEKPNAQPGEFVGGKKFDVACSDGVIRFVEIQPEGGKRMASQAYLNGKPVKSGTLLG